MTKQSEVKDDPRFISCLDHGFVGLVSWMGDDSSITQAARVSYGEGTKKVSEDRHLIRYMLRHQHTSPFEQVEFKFHMKMPIFVARQLVRHRTANINELSGRYSEMPNEFYSPELDKISPQSTENHQGRGGEMSQQNKEAAEWFINAASESSFDIYQTLLGKNRDNPDAAFGPYDGDMFDDEYQGIARELARMVLPLNVYTEWYWKCDLKNIMHFLNLRQDSHAQYEIQVFANAVRTLIEPIVPVAMEAFNDYWQNAVSLSRMEVDLLKEILEKNTPMCLDQDVSEKHGLSKREIKEFADRFGFQLF